MDLLLELQWQQARRDDMPLGANKAALFAMGGAAGGGNYFGDDSDGTLSTSGSVTYTVPNKNGANDGDMVVKNYTNLTVNATHVVTVDQQCRGLLLYCTGDLVVSGDLSLGTKGSCSDPTASGGSDASAVSATGIRLPMLTASGTDTLAAADFAGCGNGAVAAVANQPAISGDGTIFTIARAGASGGTGCSVGHNTACTTDTSSVGDGTTGGASLSAGGGGGGNAWGGGGSGTAHGSAGADGGCFSGGGGGGSAACSGCTCTGGVGVFGCGGAGCSGGGITGGAAGDGGGLMIIAVGGNVTINSGGNISVQGGAGTQTGSGAFGGVGAGGGGGGELLILHGGTFTNNGTASVNPGGSGKGGSGGGTGGFYNVQVSE